MRDVTKQAAVSTNLKKKQKKKKAVRLGGAGPSNYQPKKSRRDRFHDNFDYMLDTVDELGDKRSVGQTCQPRSAEKEEHTIFCLQRKKNRRSFA